jgi:phenylalanyl-tRNA synthetase beta chain
LEDLRVPALTLTPRDGDAATDGPAPVTQHHIDVATGDTALGTVARVRDDVAADFDCDTPAFVAEFHWAALVDAATAEQHRNYEPVSRFPVVDRDLAVLVHTNQPVGPLQATIRSAGAPLLRRIDVFDVYAGEGIDADTKSVAFTLRFGADRTLTDEEVDTQIDTIVDALAQDHNARLRQ